MSWSKYGREVAVENFDLPLFLRGWHGGSPKILDVGCGMSYTFGSTLDGHEADVTFVDPLARFYNRILQKHHLGLPEITFGMIEYLSSFYPHGDVAFIQVQNALDHCFNPMKGIVECLRTLAPGGVLYLRHHRNEAEHENYMGFHQYNIDFEQGRLVIWNRTNRHDVAEYLQGFATVETSDGTRGDVIAVVTKTAEVPSSEYDDNGDRAALSASMLEIAEYLNSMECCMSYHVHSLFFSMSQLAVRFLSPSTREKLKRILSKGK